jgi:Protein of unknown function (DUF3579)
LTEDISVAVQQVIIRGVTQDGKKFRPSDWAERLYTAVASYGPDRRPIFPPHVHLTMKDGMKCVAIDLRMADENPLLYAFLVGFAHDNELTLTDAQDQPVAESDLPEP